VKHIKISCNTSYRSRRYEQLKLTNLLYFTAFLTFLLGKNTLPKQIITKCVYTHVLQTSWSQWWLSCELVKIKMYENWSTNAQFALKLLWKTSITRRTKGLLLDIDMSDSRRLLEQ